jgi:preprotein translocase subunit SecG
MILAAVLHGILSFFFAVLAILLMIVILLQRGRGVGLAGAFGGMGGHTAFGAKTGDFLTWVTVVGAAVLLLFSVFLNYVFVPGKPSLAPAAPPVPTTQVAPAGPTDQTPASPSGGSSPAAPGQDPSGPDSVLSLPEPIPRPRVT